MSFWDKVSFVYDLAESLNGAVYSEMCDITARVTPYGANVLDCAAGTGELAFAAAQKAESVLCTDLSEKMLKTAKVKAEMCLIDNVYFEVRNIFDLADPDESYDIVIAGNVLHLLEEPQKAVRELYRVTKHGGKILLPCFMQAKKMIGNAALSIYKKMGFDPRQEFTPDSYKKMLSEMELGDVRCKLIRGTIPCCYAIIFKK